MITDERVEAAWTAMGHTARDANTGEEYTVRLITKNDLRAAIEAAEEAAWQHIGPPPRNQRIMIKTAVDTYVAQWAKNPFTDDIGYVVSRSGEDQHVIEPGKIECWRPLPAAPKEA